MRVHAFNPVTLRLYGRRTLLLAVALLTMVIALEWYAPQLDVTLDSGAFKAASGAAYSIDFSSRQMWPYAIVSDNSEHPRQSLLTLREAGHALGPAHVLHRTIADAGGGRYAHWSQDLLFSASDNSDPRSNGRRYTASAPTHVAMEVWVAATFLLLFALALTIGGSRSYAQLAAAVFLPVEQPMRGPTAAAIVVGSILITCTWVIVRWATGDGPGLSLSGYLPLSDAGGYTACAAQIAGFGEVAQSPGFCMRRLLYPSFIGGLLVLYDYDWQLVLLTQSALAGLSLGLALLALLRVAGLFGTVLAGILLLAYARQHVLSLFMTEFAGLTFGLLTLALILNLRQVEQRLTALAVLTTFSLGMVSRVGPLFSLPAVGVGVLWQIWRGPPRWRKRWTVIASVALMAGFLTQSLLSTRLHLPVSGTFGNFSTVLYRLSVGARDYSQAYRDQSQMFAVSGEHAGYHKLYRIAFENIVAEPGVFIASLSSAMKSYQWSLFSLDGINPWRHTLAALLLIGLLDCAWRWRTPGRVLLMAVTLGEIASGPFIVEDGGLRLFAVTFPVRAALLALGCAAIARGLQRALSWRTITLTSVPATANGSRSAGLHSALTFAMVVAMLLIMVLPVTPLANPRRFAVLDERGCQGDDLAVAARLDGEAMNLVLVSGTAQTQLRPLRSRFDAVRQAAAPTWYADNVAALPVPVLIVQAVHRGGSHFGRLAQVLMPLQSLAPLPDYALFCIRPGSQAELGGTPYDVAYAMYPISPL